MIKNLKYVHQRVTLRRKEGWNQFVFFPSSLTFANLLLARDMWKKKYFQEKKKTPPVEEKVTQLKADLDFTHSKVLQTIDNECKHSAQAGCIREAETGVREFLFPRKQ